MAFTHLLALAAAVQCVPQQQALRPPPTAAPHATYFSNDTPPVRFQADRKVTVVFMSDAAVNQFCAAHLPPLPCGMRWGACAVGDTLYMPNSCATAASDSYAHLLCHEVAHLNGWPETHGD